MRISSFRESFSMSAISSALLLLVVLGAEGLSDEQQVLRSILNSYDTSVPPDRVSLRYHIVYLECPQLDDDTGNLVSRVQENYQWTDDRLRWRPGSFGGVRSVEVTPTSRIWRPDMRLVDGTMTPSNDRVTVSETGSVTRSRTLLLNTNCEPIGPDNTWKCRMRFTQYVFAGDDFVLTGPTFSQDLVPADTCPPGQKVEYSTVHERTDVFGFAHYSIELVMQPRPSLLH